MPMAGPQLYERAHYRHDPHWLLPVLEAGEVPLCLACVIEMMEDGMVSVVRKKHMLSSFQECLQNNPSTVVGLLLNDSRICTHFIEQLLGMLVNSDDNNTTSALVIEILVQIIVDLKQEECVHCILHCCQKELSAVSCMRLSRPVICFLAKLLDAIPNATEIFVADHYNLVEELPHGLMYPNEELKAAVCYLYGKLYSSQPATKQLSVHFTDKLCRLLLATLENAQTKELQINCMGLLKQLLNVDHFVPVIMNASVLLEESEDTPTLQAQNPLPFLLKKILLSKEEFLQIASAQCITAVLVHSPASYAPAFIYADIPEFLFENLLSRSEVLIWSIYCCLLLMTEESLFFTKGHTAYGIEAVLRSLRHVLKLNNKELQKQGLLLLTEILNRQPNEIKLFTNPGIFKAAIDVLQEAVSSSVLEATIEGTKAASAFLRKDHLSIPVQYDDLERLIRKMMECCADLPLTLLKRKKSVNRDGIKTVTRYGQLLTNILEGFHNACKLAMDCQSDFTAQDNAFTAPSSKSTNTLEAFTWFLLNACDNVCIPTVLKYYEHLPVPATMETFFSLLSDILTIVPTMKETISLKLASSSFIRLSMDVKSTLCSAQRNSNLNNACSVFLTNLCFTLWEIKAGQINDSGDVTLNLLTETFFLFTEVYDILNKSMIHIEGNVAESLSVLLDSPDIHTTKDLRCHQQALICIACVAYLMEDRFIPEKDLFWAVLAFLHSVQSQQYNVSTCVTRASLYLLVRCQDKCKDMNMMSVNVVCRLIENISEVRLVYFHHPLFIKFFFHYPQLLEKYGSQIMKLWMHKEDSSTVSEKNSNLIPTAHDSLNPILNILHSYPNALLVLLAAYILTGGGILKKQQRIRKKQMHKMNEADGLRYLDWGSKRYNFYSIKENNAIMTSQNLTLILRSLIYSSCQDLINNVSEDVADKGLLILKAFLRENDSFSSSNLLLNRLLRIFQEIVALPDTEVEKKLPLILRLLCLIQQKSQSDSQMDGTYFKLLYHVSSLTGKCNPCHVNILQPAFSFIYSSLHQSSTSCKMRATAMLLSNTPLIELLDKLVEYTWDETKIYPNELFGSLCCSALLMTSSLILFQKFYALQNGEARRSFEYNELIVILKKPV
ncbi:meiosis inhibitor protein 1 [Pyxicephalus adspersus]|uniref:meiosis inhibitor protein 1 n=1 Tax=Pyxicephalus adspersus TaxID=30357 RepID=UPI003B5C31BB